MVKLLIIADDFTGALDTGIKFVNKGIATQVFTKMPEAIGDIDESTEVCLLYTSIKIENIAYNNPITVSPISYYSIIHFNYIIYTMLRPFLSQYAHIKELFCVFCTLVLLLITLIFSLTEFIKHYGKL